ncbi:MAG: hypothetical protein V2A58_11620, partial [Planctomycetota bacterium]
MTETSKTPKSRRRKSASAGGDLLRIPFGLVLIALAASAVYKAFSSWSPQPARIVIAVFTCLVAAVFLIIGLV